MSKLGKACRYLHHSYWSVVFSNCLFIRGAGACPVFRWNLVVGVSGRNLAGYTRHGHNVANVRAPRGEYQGCLMSSFTVFDLSKFWKTYLMWFRKKYAYSSIRIYGRKILLTRIILVLSMGLSTLLWGGLFRKYARLNFTNDILE